MHDSLGTMVVSLSLRGRVNDAVLSSGVQAGKAIVQLLVLAAGGAALCIAMVEKDSGFLPQPVGVPPAADGTEDK